MNVRAILTVGIVASIPYCAMATNMHSDNHTPVSDDVIKQQRAALAKNTEGQGFGPQSPRDLDSHKGNNNRVASAAPAYNKMNLCDIHFHKNAEHKGGEFTEYAGNGDGQGYMTGYRYSGELSEAELAPVEQDICPGEYGSLQAGDTIELHYVHSTAKAKPGPTLGTCFDEAVKNPQLRVEAQVMVLVNDDNAQDFGELTRHGMKNGLHQALNIPDDTGTPVQYAGSTTGPAFNEYGSPFHVSWSVPPKVVKVQADSVGKWCENNDFNEDDAHGARNLVINPDLLSEITE